MALEQASAKTHMPITDLSAVVMALRTLNEDTVSIFMRLRDLRVAFCGNAEPAPDGSDSACGNGFLQNTEILINEISLNVGLARSCLKDLESVCMPAGAIKNATQ